jgi:hypothetical protein
MSVNLLRRADVFLFLIGGPAVMTTNWFIHSRPTVVDINSTSVIRELLSNVIVRRISFLLT